MSAANELMVFLGGLAGLLAIFTAVIFWSVKSQVSSLRQSNTDTSKALQNHIDHKLEEVGQEVKAQTQRIDAHDKQIHDQHVAQLKLRNEMLESMRTTYVRHGDMEEIKNQVTALFSRLDKVIFSNHGNGRE